jgi:hypothetical protein
MTFSSSSVGLLNSRRTSKQRVAGSSPAGIAKRNQEDKSRIHSRQNTSCTHGAHIRHHWRTQSQSWKENATHATDMHVMRSVLSSLDASTDTIPPAGHDGSQPSWHEGMLPQRHDGLQPHRYGANQSPRFLFASRHWAHFTLIQSHLPACKARSCVSTRCLRARAARIRQGAAFTDSVASPSSWLLIGV